SVCGAGAALILAIIAFLLYKRHRRIKEAQARIAKEREGILNASNGDRAAKLFNGKEIKKATNDFSCDRLLGVGGYGEVYKGILQDGTVVAVKCAKLGNPKGTDQVLNEKMGPFLITCKVKCLRAVTGLHGLIAFKLHDTAEGLAYLHFMAVPPIYHRDVKSSNILLDIKLNAKVSDFGLSRLARTNMSHISTCAQGTLGYLDLEYYRNYQLIDKSDVYSFGVVLLEVLTAQKALDFNRAVDDVNLAVYVHRMVTKEKLLDVIDPVLKMLEKRRDNTKSHTLKMMR
ncbi:Wall-associated receptor kinase-like 20, partial [Glycine soja]